MMIGSDKHGTNTTFKVLTTSLTALLRDTTASTMNSRIRVLHLAQIAPPCRQICCFPSRPICVSCDTACHPIHQATPIRLIYVAASSKIPVPRFILTTSDNTLSRHRTGRILKRYFALRISTLIDCAGANRIRKTQKQQQHCTHSPYLLRDILASALRHLQKIRMRASPWRRSPRGVSGRPAEASSAH